MNAQQLTTQNAVMTERIDTLNKQLISLQSSSGETSRELTQLRKDHSDAKNQTAIVELRLEKEAAILRTRLDEATKRIETWSTRAWSLVPIFIGAILSLSAGLIVALVKR